MTSKFLNNYLDEYDFDAGKDVICDTIFSNFKFEGEKAEFLRDVELPLVIYTPSFGSGLQEMFSYVDYKGDIIFFSGPLVIEGVREKRNGTLALVFRYLKANYALIANVVYPTSLPMGRYEVIGDLIYAIDFPVKGWAHIGGSHCEVIWDPFVTMDTFVYDPLKMEGAILLIGGFQFKWKEVWTVDVVVTDCVGSMIKVMGRLIECGALVRAGDVVEVAVEGPTFIRVRSDKKKGQETGSILNATPFSWFKETVPMQSKVVKTVRRHTFCFHDFQTKRLRDLFKRPATFSYIARGVKNVKCEHRCTGCLQLKDAGRDFADNLNELYPLRLATMEESKKLSGDGCLLDYYTSIVVGEGYTFDRMVAEIKDLPVNVKFSRGYDFLLEGVNHVKVVEFCGPRANIQGKPLTRSNDLGEMNRNWYVSMFPNNIHSITDLSLRKYLAALRPGAKVLVKTNDALYDGDIMKFHYVCDLYYNRIFLTYDQYVAKNIITLRTKDVLDGIFSAHCFLDKENTVGFDNLRVYSQVWVKKQRAEQKLRSAYVTVLGDKGKKFREENLQEEMDKLAVIWKNASKEELRYWSSRVLSGYDRALVPVPLDQAVVKKAPTFKASLDVPIFIDKQYKIFKSAEEALDAMMKEEFSGKIMTVPVATGCFNSRLAPPYSYLENDVRVFFDRLVLKGRLTKWGNEYGVV
jgi:hypothetical protein